MLVAVDNGDDAGVSAFGTFMRSGLAVDPVVEVGRTAVAVVLPATVGAAYADVGVSSPSPEDRAVGSGVIGKTVTTSGGAVSPKSAVSSTLVAALASGGIDRSGSPLIKEGATNRMISSVVHDPVIAPVAQSRTRLILSSLSRYSLAAPPTQPSFPLGTL